MKHFLAFPGISVQRNLIQFGGLAAFLVAKVTVFKNVIEFEIFIKVIDLADQRLLLIFLTTFSSIKAH